MLESKEVFETKEPKIGDSNLDTRESGWREVWLGGLKNRVDNTYLEKHQTETKVASEPPRGSILRVMTTR